MAKQKKVYHKIVTKRRVGRIILWYIFSNLFAGAILIPFSFILYFQNRQTWSLVVSTVIATLAMCFINYALKEYSIIEYETVEHEIR